MLTILCNNIRYVSTSTFTTDCFFVCHIETEYISLDTGDFACFTTSSGFILQQRYNANILRNSYLFSSF